MSLVSGSEHAGVGSLTCISCRLLFHTPKEQREHYKSDLHRFNLKRKVADLPPVTPEVFQQKVQTNAATLEAGATADDAGAGYCAVCNKKYSSANAFAEHLKSKKHLELAKNAPEGRPSRASSSRAAAPAASAVRDVPAAAAAAAAAAMDVVEAAAAAAAEDKRETARVGVGAGAAEGEQVDIGETGGEEPQAEEEEEEETEEAAIERRLREAVRLAPEDCLFCPHRAADQTAALRHMTREHGLFIPDVEYVVDLPGLLAYLADKVAVGRTCLYCGQHNFQSTAAVQAHMRDVSHAKLRYDDNETEYADYYDFSADWLKDQRHAGAGVDDELDEAVIADGLVATLDDDGHSMTLADGRVIGHRTLALYYRQRYRPEETRQSVRTLISEYKLLGWGSQALAVREPWYLEKRQQQQTQRAAYMKMTLGIKANKLKRPRRNFLAANAGY